MKYKMRVVGLLLLGVSTTVALFLSFSVLGAVDSGQDLIRLRNALIFRLGTPDEFNWSPRQVPQDFKQESRPAPAYYKELSEQVRMEGAGPNFERALGLAKILVSADARRDTPIQDDAIKTLRRIVTEGKGYCADYTLAFMGLATAAGIPVREWGMSFDRFGGDGHAFIEIFDAEQQKWIFLDPFYSFFVRGADNRAVSVAEFRHALIEGAQKSLTVEPIEATQFKFPSYDSALAYYERGLHGMFMTWGNNVFSYDAHTAVKLFGRISRSAEQMAAIIAGVHPEVHIIETQGNSAAIHTLVQLRLKLLATATAWGVTLAILIFLACQCVLGRNFRKV